MIKLVIEIESYRQSAGGGEPFTDAEKQEYKERSDIIEKARGLISAVTTGAVGNTVGNAISGLLGLG